MQIAIYFQQWQNLFQCFGLIQNFKLHFSSLGSLDLSFSKPCPEITSLFLQVKRLNLREKLFFFLARHCKLFLGGGMGTGPKDQRCPSSEPGGGLHWPSQTRLSQRPCILLSETISLYLFLLLYLSIWRKVKQISEKFYISVMTWTEHKNKWLSQWNTLWLGLGTLQVLYMRSFVQTVAQYYHFHYGIQVWFSYKKELFLS